MYGNQQQNSENTFRKAKICFSVTNFSSLQTLTDTIFLQRRQKSCFRNGKAVFALSKKEIMSLVDAFFKPLAPLLHKSILNTNTSCCNFYLGDVK